jgi:hypothetical protein
VTCVNIGSQHGNDGEYAMAASFFKRAVAAGAFSLGPAHDMTKQYLEYLDMTADDLGPHHPQADEYQQFIEDAEQQIKNAEQQHAGRSS